MYSSYPSSLYDSTTRMRAFFSFFVVLMINYFSIFILFQVYILEDTFYDFYQIEKFEENTEAILMVFPLVISIFLVYFLNKGWLEDSLLSFDQEKKESRSRNDKIIVIYAIFSLVLVLWAFIAWDSHF